MLHRAILGSVERWLGILIEQYAGRFPLWLTPIQIMVCTITDKTSNYVEIITKSLKNVGVRYDVDLRNEKIGYKIREHSENGCPIILVIGEKEMQNESVSIRRLGSNKQESQTLTSFIDFIKNEIKPPDLV